MQLIQRLDELNTLFPGWMMYQQESEVFNALGIAPSADAFMLLAQQGSNTLLLLVSPEAHNSQHFYAIGTRLLREHDVQVVQAEASILRLLASDRSEREQEEVTQRDQQLFHQLMTDAVAQGASDLMINAKRKGLYEVLYDIDTIPHYVKDLTETEVIGMMRYFYQKIADPSTVEESLFSMDSAQFAAGTGFWNNQPVRLRYQSKPAFPHGTDFSIRVLLMSQQVGFNQVDDLQLTEDQCQALHRVQHREVGAVVVAGETNSGKTTTIKVLLESIKRDRPHLVIRTLESPPEYIMEGIRQYAVRESKSVDSMRAMDEASKELMRMNPKLLFVAEVRGSESASLFLNMLESGHGVYTTTHTAGIFPIYDRLGTKGISKEVTTQAGNINALIYQKRLPRLCEHCKEPLLDHLDRYKDLICRLELVGLPLGQVYLTSPKGCHHCRQRGVSGSRIAMEIVMPNAAMSQAVIDRDRKAFYREWVSRCRESQWGDIVETHCYHAIRLMLSGEISPQTFELAYGTLDKTLLREECNTWKEKEGFVLCE